MSGNSRPLNPETALTDTFEPSTHCLSKSPRRLGSVGLPRVCAADPYWPFIYIYVYVYIYTYIYIIGIDIWYTHTNKHTYTHKQTDVHSYIHSYIHTHLQLGLEFDKGSIGGLCLQQDLGYSVQERNGHCQGMFPTSMPETLGLGFRNGPFKDQRISQADFSGHV